MLQADALSRSRGHGVSRHCGSGSLESWLFWLEQAGGQGDAVDCHRAWHGLACSSIISSPMQKEGRKRKAAPAWAFQPLPGPAPAPGSRHLRNNRRRRKPSLVDSEAWTALDGPQQTTAVVEGIRAMSARHASNGLSSHSLSLVSVFREA